MKRLLPLLLLPALLAPAAAAAAPGTTTLLDRPSGFSALPYDGIRETQLARHSLSANGCFAVFESDSDDLVATDDNGAENVFRQNLCAPGSRPQQVNTSAAGRPAAGGTFATDPTISADGRYVAFRTDAENLDPAARGAGHYVFRKDMQTGAIVLMSRGNGPSGALVHYPSAPVISGNGAAVAFIATGKVHAANADGVDNSFDVYVRYATGATTYMASVKDGGGEGGGVDEGQLTGLDVDYRGVNVAFVTEHALDPADTDTSADAYERQGIGTIGQHTQIVSFTGTNQLPGADSADDVAIASDGSHVAYTNGKLWISACSPCGAAKRVDEARTGGTNTTTHSDPFFAQTGDNPPAHVFWRTASGLDPADLNHTADLYSSALAGADPVRLVTTGAADGSIDGGDATDGLTRAVFTANAATNLPGGDGEHTDVYDLTQGTVHNLRQLAGIPLRVSQAGNSFILARHAASDDARVGVFLTDSPALGAPLLEGRRVTQAVARDTATGVTALLSAAPDGHTPADRFVETVSVDGAGRRVVFSTAATNLVPGTPGGYDHVYVRDLVTHKTLLVDRAANGAPALYGAADPQISGDGRTVVFDSGSPDLPGAPNDGLEHVYRLRLSDGAVELIDRTSAGVTGDDHAFDPDISADGRHVTFISRATNLGGPATSYGEVYVRDLDTGTTTWASVHGAAAQVAAAPAISGDGTRVAYEAEPVTTLAPHVYVRDLARRTTMTVPVPGTGEDGPPSISRDGRSVAFARFTSSGTDAPYVRDLATGTVARVDLRDGSSAPGRFGGDAVSLAGNGRCALFDSASDDLTRPGYGANYGHVYRRCAGTASAPPHVVRDTTAPRIRGLHMTHRRFRPHRHATAFVFRLSERARTRITIRGKHGKRRAVLTRRSARAGRNKVLFSGRAHGRKLKAGPYRATVVATDGAGNRSHPVSVRFKVLRRR